MSTLVRLDKLFTKRYGQDWVSLETETLSLDTGAAFDPHTVEKIQMIKAIKHNPLEFLENADYFLRFVEVANGHLLEPEFVHMPNSLELAWALVELKGLISIPDSSVLATICHYVLQEEGYAKAVPPFDFIKEPLTTDQSEEETANKAKAIRLYIRAMEESI